MKKKNIAFITALLALLLYINNSNDIIDFIKSYINPIDYSSYELEEIPKDIDQPYVILNNNEPIFDDKDKTLNTFEIYSSLDKYGRAGIAYANVGIETMPNVERGSIGGIKPSGWHTVKYENVEGGYLYNRCHLIGYQLTGENSNTKNLITCTRHMNTKGMLEFENKVANYVKETKNHVLYRVTPIYEGSNLLASGVKIEAYSIEDNGAGVKFNVYVYNKQDGIKINYETGNSKLLEK